MIFWFSGTGNSLHAARTISEAQGERLLAIPEELERKPAPSYALGKDELLGFVFPVHAWGPPSIVLDFIGRLEVQGRSSCAFSVAVCGDEEGRTTDILRKALSRRGIALDSAYTIRMPNNYIIAFDVDTPEVEGRKLAEAVEVLAGINADLSARRRGVFRLIPGSLPGLKSAVVRPLFNRFGRSAGPFFAAESCTACGLCARICPLHTITVTDRPSWSGACLQCLACLHRCPVRAIQYGKGTARKGRYVHPDLRVPQS